MLENFIQYLRYEKSYSSYTVLSYKKDIEQFIDFLKENKLHAKIETVTSDEIRLWAVALMEKNAPKSVSRKLSSLKSFYRYLLKSNTVTKNPTTCIAAPRRGERLPNFFSEKEMNLQQEHKIFVHETEFEAERNDLIIEMLYQTGMRRSELISLKDSHLDFYRKTLNIFGKRKKERIMPLGEKLLEQILHYIEMRNKEIPRRNDNFFILKNGKAMYPEAIYNIVVRRMGAVTTQEKHSPHILRHTFATAMLNNGAELSSVKELLGHSSLASTQVYTHITFEELQKIYRKAHPRAEKQENFG
ncbi:MAG: tyrosine-type recombinase/integrase [Prevotellaceae bacterium]|jgi:integrase/recombinase XerC|nr:tyrosine-type recombinase/integrase [Prevotellaceae bacterium]